jgi:chloramphenicol-sensitive protein RarD
MNYFTLADPPLMFILFLAGPMTVIPLFLYIRGVAILGLGPTGMIFFIAPSGQFLLGFFYYNELFTADKFISFILIWIAVIIYLRDLYQNK